MTAPMRTYSTGLQRLQQPLLVVIHAAMNIDKISFMRDSSRTQLVKGVLYKRDKLDGCSSAPTAARGRI
jgi:hypothetical protein